MSERNSQSTNLNIFAQRTIGPPLPEVDHNDSSVGMSITRYAAISVPTLKPFETSNTSNAPGRPCDGANLRNGFT